MLLCLKMKITLFFACLVVAIIQSGCSCAIYHREFKAGRSLTSEEQANVARALSASSFVLQSSPNTTLATKVVIVKQQSGEIFFHDSLCPFLSAAFYYPGPDRWYQNNEKEVSDVMSRIQDDGLAFTRINCTTSRAAQPLPAIQFR
jgi:hypothetical protein